MGISEIGEVPPPYKIEKTVVLGVRVLDEDNPIHVPMNLWARTSVLDLWLAVEKCPKSVL